MKTVLAFTWWVTILTTNGASANGDHGANKVFQHVIRSPSTPQKRVRTKKATGFSSIFVQENAVSGGSSSGFKPLGKETQQNPIITPIASPIASPTISPIQSPTVAVDGRNKGDTIPPEASPTQSPTFYETIEALEVEDDQGFDRPIKQKATVVAEPRTIQLKGAFDARQSEETIFEVVESLMKTYMQTYAGSIMESFELALTFFHEYDHMTSVQGASTMTMYFNVDVVFYIVSYNMDELADFSSTNKATKLIDRFFSGNQLIRLKRRLNTKSLKIQGAQLLTSIPENIPKSETGDAYQLPEDSTMGRKFSATTTLYAAMASGAIMFFAIVFIILISRREMRKTVKTLPNSKSPSSGSVSSHSSTVSGGIKPAALHVRRKREEEQARKMETSSLDGFSYSDKRFGSTLVRAHQPFLNSSRLGAKPRGSNFVIDDDDDDDNNDDDDDESLDRLEDGLVSSGALTCLDQERTEISSEYPEFELFAHIPRQVLEAKPKLPVPPSSSVWSVSATSDDNGSAAEDADYAEQRRRWQDQQLDDLALVALPDHTSDKGGYSEGSTMSSSDRSDDDQSKTTRNSSCASESSDVPLGLRREDEI